MKKIFMFDAMLTPKIITFVYWIAIASSVIGGLLNMDTYYGVTVASFLSGVGIMVGGIVVSRVWCELLIVIFKINANLQKIADREQ